MMYSSIHDVKKELFDKLRQVAHTHEQLTLNDSYYMFNDYIKVNEKEDFITIRVNEIELTFHKRDE